MEEEKEPNDPFGWLIKSCQLTAVQEERLRSCRFARETGDLPANSPVPVSIKDSHPACSNTLRRHSTTGNVKVRAAATVDLGDKENLGFQGNGCLKESAGTQQDCVTRKEKVKVLECDFYVYETQPVDPEVIILDSEEDEEDAGPSKRQRAASMLDPKRETNGCGKNLRHGDGVEDFVQGVELNGGIEIRRKGIDFQGGRGNNKVENLRQNCASTSRFCGGLKLQEDGLRDCGIGAEGIGGRKSQVDGLRSCDVRVEGSMQKSGREGDSGGEKLCHIGEGSGSLRIDNSCMSRNGDGKTGEMPKLEGNGGIHISSSDDMDGRGKQQGTLGKRKLPLTVTDKEKALWNDGEHAANVGTKCRFLMDILEVTKVFNREENEGPRGDFLETAQAQGMILPRPRWWPPDMN